MLTSKNRSLPAGLIVAKTTVFPTLPLCKNQAERVKTTRQSAERYHLARASAATPISSCNPPSLAPNDRALVHPLLDRAEGIVNAVLKLLEQLNAVKRTYNRLFSNPDILGGLKFEVQHAR